MLEPGLVSMSRCVLCGHPVWLPRVDRDDHRRALVANVCCYECMPHDLEARGIWNTAGRPIAAPAPFAPRPVDEPPAVEMLVLLR